MQSCLSRKHFRGKLSGGRMANGRCSRIQQIIKSTSPAFISTVDTIELYDSRHNFDSIYTDVNYSHIF